MRRNHLVILTCLVGASLILGPCGCSQNAREVPPSQMSDADVEAKVREIQDSTGVPDATKKEAIAALRQQHKASAEPTQAPS